MAKTKPEQPVWDATNQRFQMPDRCPYPDCARPVSPTNAAATLAWCASCHRPYEAVRVGLAEGTSPIELYRRPQSAYCTYTGQPLTGYSMLDWSEAGGGPGRSNSLDDARGAIFGAPDPRTKIRIVEDWSHASMLSQRDPEDHVSAISVARGQTVAVTARGRIGIFDAVSGEARLDRPLDWPDGSTDPMDPDYSVIHAPVFRGTRMVLLAAHQAQFRDLKPFLLRGDAADSRFVLVEPDADTAFLGPPLGVDAGTETFFCLLQGRTREDGIHDAVLRFFTLPGEEVIRCPCDGIARPPVFDRHTGHVVWVHGNGVVSALAADQVADRQRIEPITSPPTSMLQVEPSSRPTLIAARDTNRRTELWLASEPDGQAVLYRCVLDDVLGKPDQSWYWDKRALGKLGSLRGFGVGIGSRYRDNAAGQLLGVATDRQVSLFQRFSTITSTHPMQGRETTGNRGSFDPPLICSAGVIARLQGFLCLDNQGVGWNDEVLHPKAQVPGIYDRSQGIAMFGRRVYVGHVLGVRCYRLEPEVDG